jgi:putative transposase
MKKTKFSVEQIIRILGEAESGVDTVLGVCRKHGISDATFYNWKKKYSGLSVSEAHKLKTLEDENSKLKRLLAERDLEVDALKDVIKRNF